MSLGRGTGRKNGKRKKNRKKEWEWDPWPYVANGKIWGRRTRKGSHEIGEKEISREKKKREKMDRKKNIQSYVFFDI